MNGWQDENIVSIFCLTYNHKKYIRQALEGFVSQKTDFNFEVLVHDDASTDGTTDIIREYESKYPSIIKPIYQKENQFSKPDRKGIISTFLLPRAKGKYFAWCEGDDYWTDPYKLQKQVEMLENHADCVACFCNVTRVTLKGTPFGKVCTLQEEGVIESDRYLRYCLFPGGLATLPFHLSGFMIRAEEYRSYTTDPPSFKQKFSVGDMPLFLYCGTKGNIYYINKEMSCYRMGNSESWVGRMWYDPSASIKHYECEKEALLFFDEFCGGRYHEEAHKAGALRDFYIYRKTQNIKAMKSPAMREFYRQLSTKRKVKHVLCHYFPWIDYLWTLYKKERQRIS